MSYEKMTWTSQAMLPLQILKSRSFFKAFLFFMFIIAISWNIYNARLSRSASHVVTGDDATAKYQDGESEDQLFLESVDFLAGCKNFNERAKYPATRFLGPDGLAKEGTSAEASTVPNRIIFLHTWSGGLNSSAYLCTIESALRQNPDHDIVVYVRDVDVFKKASGPWVRSLRDKGMLAAGRLRFVEVVPEHVLADTPLLAWWNTKKWSKGSWIDQNISNALRLALIYKHGGVYMDMDMLSINPISSLGRALVKEDQETINNAVLSFPPHDKFVWLLMEDFVKSFDGFKWANQGSKLLTRVYKRVCGRVPTSPPIRWIADRERRFGKVDNERWVAMRLKPQEEASENGRREKNLRVAKVARRAADDYDGVCKDVAIAHAGRFFPNPEKMRYVNYQPAEQYCDLLDWASQWSIGFHWWSRMLSGDVERNITDKVYPRGSVLVTAMNASCPVVFETYSEAEMGIE